MDIILDETLKESEDLIGVQDHSQPILDEFTFTKTYQKVRERFDIAIQDRGCPWNCREIQDQLSRFKGPMALQYGGEILN